MKSVFNPALFHHQTVATSALNNLCTVIHKLREEGTYSGEVRRGKHLIGTFGLRFDKKLPPHQVHIDMAQYDPLFSKEGNKSVERLFEVGGEGYVVFYTSGVHADLRVKLHHREERKVELSYDTSRLTVGDMVALRLGTPGAYRIQHATKKHSMALVVRSATEGKFPNGLGKFLPGRVKLTTKGFEPAQVEHWPLQALIVEIELEGAELQVEYSKPPSAKTGAKPKRR